MSPTPYDISVLAGKAAVVLIVLVIFYRLLGKRQVGQMNLYDLVTLMAVSNAVQNAMTEGRGELLVGLTTSFSILLVAYLLNRVFVFFPKGERVAFGDPVVLLLQGKVDRKRLAREQISDEELHEALRQHGLSHFRDAAMAVLERDGSISVIPKGGVVGGQTDLL